MQMTTFAIFEAELAKLCEAHDISLSVTEDGRIGAWDRLRADRPIYDLIDCRSPCRAVTMARESKIPDIFFDGLSASLHVGLISAEKDQEAALAIAGRKQDATVVPIGSGADRRAWAVIGRRRSGRPSQTLA